MEKQWIDATPPRERRTLLTVVGSVLLHGSIIAVAALYPVRYVQPPICNLIDPLKPIQGDEPPPPVNVLPLPPTANDPNLPPPSELQPPIVTEAPMEPLPPTEDPAVVDPTPPKPASRTVAHKMLPLRSSLPGTARGVPGAPAGAAVGAVGVVKRWGTPQPPYPYTIRASHVQGSGSVRITTDGSGRVVSASMVQSTGNALLDDNTSHFARTAWSGPPNASVTVPITYQMP